MPSPRTRVRLTGEYALGVDIDGCIAIVVGISPAPTRLWADLLASQTDRPTIVTSLTANRRDASTTEPPTQIELRVSEATAIASALDWLTETITAVNDLHDTNERNLAAIYNDGLAATKSWFAGPHPAGRAPHHPGLN